MCHEAGLSPLDYAIQRSVVLARRIHDIAWRLRNLRTIELFERARVKIGFQTSSEPSEKEKNEKTLEVLRNHINEEHSSRLILVYLPTLDDLRGKGPEQWATFIENESHWYPIDQSAQ